jgi:hypothetical protein
MKSQFDPVLTISEGYLDVVGPFDQGPEDPLELPVQLLTWRLDQGDQTLFNTIQAWGSRWIDRVELPPAWTEGPADAQAIVIRLWRNRIETLTWSNQVVLKQA